MRTIRILFFIIVIRITIKYRSVPKIVQSDFKNNVNQSIYGISDVALPAIWPPIYSIVQLLRLLSTSYEV